jgi:hypothetical protein
VKLPKKNCVIRPIIEYIKKNEQSNQRRMEKMIHLSLGNISIIGIENSSGVFIGKKNTLKAFHSERIINEVVGGIAGNENLIRHNQWEKNKRKGKDE